jgi:molybdenum cofactor synthesis domain-containing protein
MLRSKIQATMSSKLRAAIIVISETASKDASTDKCIPALQEVFQQDGGDRWETAETRIVADDVSAIRSAIKAYTDGADNANLVVTSGGTGFAQKDVTPEVSYEHRINNMYACTQDQILTTSGCKSSHTEARTWTGPRHACGVPCRDTICSHVAPSCRRPEQHPYLDTSRLSQRCQREPSVCNQDATSRLSAGSGHGLTYPAFWWHRKARTGCWAQKGKCSTLVSP